MDKKKIILIEDDVFINDLYKISLGRYGYTTISAFDGEEGLEKVFQNTDAALVLLDVMLPKMHGIDVLNKIKSDDAVKHLDVILLSNLGEENIIKNAIKSGARDYLKKVLIPPKQLVECVTKYIDDPTYTFTNNR